MPSEHYQHYIKPLREKQKANGTYTEIRNVPRRIAYYGIIHEGKTFVIPKDDILRISNRQFNNHKHLYTICSNTTNLTPPPFDIENPKPSTSSTDV